MTDLVAEHIDRRETEKLVCRWIDDPDARLSYAAREPT
jgi:hypothetical protein